MAGRSPASSPRRISGGRRSTRRSKTSRSLAKQQARSPSKKFLPGATQVISIDLLCDRRGGRDHLGVQGKARIHGAGLLGYSDRAGENGTNRRSLINRQTWSQSD